MSDRAVAIVLFLMGAAFMVACLWAWLTQPYVVYVENPAGALPSP